MDEATTPTTFSKVHTVVCILVRINPFSRFRRNHPYCRKKLPHMKAFSKKNEKKRLENPIIKNKMPKNKTIWEFSCPGDWVWDWSIKKTLSWTIVCIFQLLTAEFRAQKKLLNMTARKLYLKINKPHGTVGVSPPVNFFCHWVFLIKRYFYTYKNDW